jgi:hypothetical protein
MPAQADSTAGLTDMKTMTYVERGFTFRWAGGTFVAVWPNENADEHVPYDMAPVPDWVTRKHASREVLATIARTWLAETQPAPEGSERTGETC